MNQASLTPGSQSSEETAERHALSLSQGRKKKDIRQGIQWTKETALRPLQSVPLQIRQWLESYRVHLDFHFEFFRCVNSINIWNRFRDLVIIRSISFPTSLLL